MADGDLYITVTLADPGGAPSLGAVGEDIYSSHRAVAFADQDNGWALAHLCEAEGRMWQPIDDLIRDSDAGPGWSSVMDVDRAATENLPFLGQFVGVRQLAGLSDTDQRDAIRRRDGFWRGRPEAIVARGQRYTVDGQGVSIRERYDPSLGAGVDAPYHLQVRVKRSKLRAGQEAEMRKYVLAGIPGALKCDITVSDDRDFDDVAATWATFDDVLTGVTDFDHLLNEGT